MRKTLKRFLSNKHVGWRLVDDDESCIFLELIVVGQGRAVAL
jgi:hypothetical protein